MSSPFPFRRHLRPGEKVLLSLSADRVGPNAAHPSIDTRVLATIHSTEGQDGVTAIRLTLAEYDQRGGNVPAEASTARVRRHQRQHAAITKAIRDLRHGTGPIA